EGVSRDERRGLALVAHVEGWTDAVVAEPDPDVENFELELAPEAVLGVQVGYRDHGAWSDYEFRLQYAAREGPRAKTLDLGPFEPTANHRVYRGITPGIYRALWGKRGATAEEPLRSAEVIVTAGTRAQLTLIIDEARWQGVVVKNGQPLERGTVFATADPGDPNSLRSAPVAAGRFEIVLPGGVREAYFAAVPERTPSIIPDVARGVAVPRARIELPRRAADGEITVEYDAYDLEISIPAELLGEEPELAIEFPHYSWDGRQFQSEPRRERLQSANLRLDQIAAGEFTFSILAAGRWSRTRTIRIEEDTTYRFSR
ncbi:MAG: hypothetical protein L0Z55_13240, partial [Planctomycetes bacterium]|nr:hypothetical protein [Planctomycetota bacterium]